MSDDQLPLGTPMGWTPADRGATAGDPDGSGEAGAEPVAGAADASADAGDAVADATAGGTPDIAPEGMDGPPAGDDQLTVAQGPTTADPAAVDAPLMPGQPGAAPGGAIGVDGWSAPTTPPAKRRFGGLARLIVPGIIVLVVVGGIVFRDRISGNAGNLQVGDCFDEPNATAGAAKEVKDVQHHPCSEPHLFEVFAVIKHPAEKGAAVPSESVIETYVLEKCDPAFTAYVGVPEAGSGLTWSAYTPSDAGWNKGDREIFCYAQDPNLAKITGSVQNSKR